MISIDEDVFHRIVEKEEKLPENVEKWFAFHRGTGRLYLVPIGEFSTGSDSVDGVGAAKTKILECSAVIKGHYPRYSYRRDKTLMFCGCACNRKCKALFAVGKDPDRDIPSTWEEVVTVKTRKKHEIWKGKRSRR
jgi:hypothetical protein